MGVPPHCDSLDGPVVKAASDALENEDVERVLPFVYKEGEAELRDAFDLALKARTQGPEAREVADRFFFETAVRIHRAGEGAPYTGLKPAGLDVGPVIPLAERAINEGLPQRLIGFFIEEVQAEIASRFDHMREAKAHRNEGTDEARKYVSTMLGLQVWAHTLYGALKAEDAHGAAADGNHKLVNAHPLGRIV
jgi:hypothetical protein